MHDHNCPLCDKDYPCNDLGCEELTSNVCKQCFEPEPENVVRGEE